MSKKTTIQKDDNAAILESDLEEGNDDLTEEESEDGEQSTTAEQASLSADEDKAEAEKEQADHQKRMYDGIVKSYITKIVMGEDNPRTGKVFALTDIRDEQLRKVVSEKLSSVKEVMPAETTNEDRLVGRLMEELDLKNSFESLDDVERDAALKEYRAFRSRENGDIHTTALLKTRKLFGVLSKQEQEKLDMSFGQRARKTGTASVSGPTLTEEDEKVVEMMKDFNITVKPENVLKARQAL